MGVFLEERFPPDIDYGSGFGMSSANRLVPSVGGNEYRSLAHPFVMASLDVDFTRQQKDVIKRIIDLNLRANGMYRGFRVYNYVDFSTNNYRDPPTAFDMPMLKVSAATYQLMRWYGVPTDPLCARRRIRKPVANNVYVGVNGAVHPAAQWSVDTTTGIVSFAANKSRNLSGITKAANAVLEVGTNTFAVGESVVITQVVGMTQINGLRALITAKPDSTHITVAINSSGFDSYASGGVVQTQPLDGEPVTAGCIFDIPMRFDADLSGVFTAYGVLQTSSIGLVEILNP